MDGVERLKEIVSVHIKNVERRECRCAFYRLGEEPRCLLENFFNAAKEFSPVEAKEICGYRHARRRTRCQFPYNPSKGEGRYKKLEGENNKLKGLVELCREKISSLKGELTQVVEELKGYKKGN